MNNYKNRLRYRCWHRGTKEADLILGGFFDYCYNSLDEKSKKEFEEFIDQVEDADVLSLINKVKTTPRHLPTNIVNIFKSYLFKR